MDYRLILKFLSNYYINNKTLNAMKQEKPMYAPPLSEEVSIVSGGILLSSSDNVTNLALQDNWTWDE